MLHNRFAGDALKKLFRLRDAGVEMNGQIVLCRGINDREELEYTIRELEQFLQMCIRDRDSFFMKYIKKYRTYLATIL